MTDDAELLRRFVEERAESAFAELVRRRINLVYSVAVRQCGGDAHLAEDVTQRVFIALAKKARPLSRHVALSGWLACSARFAASDLVRAERRRRAREKESNAMHDSADSGTSIDTSRLRPMLDEVLAQLNDIDRDSIALRFFDQRSLCEIGAKLGLSPDAARKRVDRALEKIRTLLAQRGITSTVAALAVALEGQAAITAPSAVTAAAISAAQLPATLFGLHLATTTMTLAGVAGLVVSWWYFQPRKAPPFETTVSPPQVAKPLDPSPEVPPASPTFADTIAHDGQSQPRVSRSLPGKQVQSTSVLNAPSTSSVTISGSVERRGRILWAEGMTLWKLLVNAGGISASARTDGIRITRKGSSGRPIILRVSLAEADRFVLAPEDDVYVPDITSPADNTPDTSPTVNVVGSVTKEGITGWAEGMTLKQAVQAVGGTTGLADVARIRVFRKDEDGRSATLIVDLDSSDSFLLRAGDIIYVPERLI